MMHSSRFDAVCAVAAGTLAALAVVACSTTTNVTASGQPDSGLGGSAGSATGGSATGGTGGTASGGKGGSAGVGQGGSVTGGKGGMGETGGSGGGTGGASGAQLGSACSKNTDCASTYCSAGRCCDQACAGTCMACSAAGKCEMPADDSACGTITCSAGSNACLAYDTSIPTDRCKALGQCKTTADCGSKPQPARTTCSLGGSSYSICDGAGQCVQPTVSCGGSCTIGENTCCYQWTASGGAVTFVCEAATSCPETFLTASPTARTPTYCDAHSDCRSGMLCSLLAASTASHISCIDAAQANQNGTYFDQYEVCQSPVMAQSACSNGAGCTLVMVNFPGWKFCVH